MAHFPLAGTGARLELDLDGTGAFATDITPYIKVSEGISITRGLSSEGSTVGPARISLTLLNGDSRFSRRNPTGPYYGQLTTNTPLRVSVPHIVTRLVVPTGVPSALATPDTAALSITGDIDIRLDLQLNTTIVGGTGCTVLHKWGAAGTRSWAAVAGFDGKPAWFWSADGSATLSATSTQYLPVGPKRQCLRITHDVNNGAAGNTVTFHTGPTLDGPWTQLGDPVVTAGTTSIFNSTSAVAVGDTATGGGRLAFRAFGARVLQGIAGTVRSALDLTGIVEGATTVTDAQGNVWTPAVGAELATRDIRGVGAVAEWPMGHGLTDDDCEVGANAYDVLRRLSRARSSLKSAYTRACTSTSAPVTGLRGYWPCEDTAGSVTLASGLSGGRPMVVSGTPTLEYDGTAFACSSPLPDLGSASLYGQLADYTSTGAVQVRMLLSIPAAGTTNGAVLLSVQTGGTAARWELVYGTGGTLSLNAYDSAGASILANGPGAFGLNGSPCRIGLQLAQSGANVTYGYGTLAPGADVGLFTGPGTLAGRTVTKATAVTVAPGRNLSGVIAGQVTVQSAVTSIFDLATQLNAYLDEIPLSRIARICSEENVSLVTYGSGGVAMGYQHPGRLIDLLREVESSDVGILFTPRDRLGVAYRSLDSLTTRDAVLTATYAGAGIAELTPVDDDQGTINDITGTRVDGSSYRLALESGPLSVLDPPLGVGQYEGGNTGSVSLASDALLPDWVSWQLHLGTVDEPRVPSITFDLGAGPHLTGSADALALAAAIRDLDIGDRLVISGTPEWDGPGDVDQLVIGTQEEIRPWEHRIVVACRPASPYRVGFYDDGISRYSGEGTVTAEDLTTTETGVNITNIAGVEWTHDDGDYVITVGGEAMLVTGVTGTGVSQTLTVTRSVNGVVKTHATGAALDLAEPCYYGI